MERLFDNMVGVRAEQRGIGLAVINPLGELWVQQDMQTKERTGRRAGDLSIIFETKKRGKVGIRESYKKNVLGAIPELVNDATLSMIQDTLVTTDRLKSTPLLSFTTSGGTLIKYIVTVGVLGYHFDQFAPEPHDNNETRPMGWMSPEELLAHDDVRPLARHAVEYMQENEIIDRALARYRSPLYANRRIIPREFNVATYYEKRERLQDMVAGKYYFFQ